MLNSKISKQWLSDRLTENHILRFLANPDFKRQNAIQRIAYIIIVKCTQGFFGETDLLYCELAEVRTFCKKLNFPFDKIIEALISLIPTFELCQRKDDTTIKFWGVTLPVVPFDALYILVFSEEWYNYLRECFDKNGEFAIKKEMSDFKNRPIECIDVFIDKKQRSKVCSEYLLDHTDEYFDEIEVALKGKRCDGKLEMMGGMDDEEKHEIIKSCVTSIFFDETAFSEFVLKNMPKEAVGPAIYREIFFRKNTFDNVRKLYKKQTHPQDVLFGKDIKGCKDRKDRHQKGFLERLL
ncbi:MAG: hypothetical protein V1913_04455, partial [Fibrobacterota bacterium]